MRWVIAALLIVHGLIHGMGFAKAFGYASLPQLTQPISRGMGVVWLIAGLLVCAQRRAAGRATCRWMDIRRDCPGVVAKQ